MLRRQFPSASSLFTFEAVARLESFSDAASELNVTQPAVSRSINSLEAHLGYSLFKRHGRWISLTSHGDRLFRATSGAFSQVANALRDIEQRRESRETVSISMAEATINYWMIPRMSGFSAKFPSIGLDLQILTREDASPPHDVDLGIRLSYPLDADMHRWSFCDEKILAVCSPQYLARNGSLDQPKTDRSHVLIEQTDQRYTLDEFFHAIGQDTPENSTFLRFSNYTSITQAAIQGQGIALAWVTDASKLIIGGQLVPACTQVVKTGRRYHIVASNLSPMRPASEDVRDWLIREMRTDQRELAAVLKANWDLF